MTKLVTAILARNEADRYLQRVIQDCQRFSDEILVLDDNSTDDTAEVARQAGATVRSRSPGLPMWGNESGARRELWEWGAEVCGDGWLYISDADHLMVGDLRPLCSSWNVNTWCFKLYDLWDDETTHRADGFWTGFHQPRPWLFRPSFQPDGLVAEWGTRGIHVGHAPCNFVPLAAVAPESYFISHLGWLRESDRREKHQRYVGQWDQMTEYERAHVSSILENACP